jgi:hypothetical protein
VISVCASLHCDTEGREHCALLCSIDSHSSDEEKCTYLHRSACRARHIGRCTNSSCLCCSTMLKIADACTRLASRAATMALTTSTQLVRAVCITIARARFKKQLICVSVTRDAAPCTDHSISKQRYYYCAAACTYASTQSLCVALALRVDHQYCYGYCYTERNTASVQNQHKKLTAYDWDR